MIIGSCSGTISSLDRMSGEPVWQHDTRVDGGRATFHGEMAVAPGAVIIPSDGHRSAPLYSFDPESGDLQWKTSLAGGVAVDPLRLDERTVVVVTPTGSIAAIDARNGRILWMTTPDGELAPDVRIASPAAAKGRVFAASSRGHLYAVDSRSGKLLWRRDLGSRVNTSLALSGGSLYAGTIGGSLLEIDPASGAVLANVALGGFGFGTLVSKGSQLLILVQGDSSELVAFDTGTKKVRWRRSTPREWTTYRPLIAGPSVIVGSEERELCSFALDDGEGQWCRPVPGVPRGLGLASDGMLYVGTLQGKVLAYRLE